jgi:probable HAF family extracellular repeat protein
MNRMSKAIPALMALSITLPVSAVTRYIPTDLGTLGGANSYPADVNDRGEVVGKSNTGDGATHAFLWSACTGHIDLGTLGGTNSEATGINNRRQVTGSSETVVGYPYTTHAFLWSAPSGLTDLGGNQSWAYGINKHGQVVGTWIPNYPSGTPHAFLWSARNGFTDLGTLPPEGDWSWAYGINDHGQVVGTSTLFSTAGYPPYHAFVGTAAGLTDLGSLPGGGQTSYGFAINKRGQVAGMGAIVDAPIHGPPGIGVYHAAVGTAAGGLTDLGTLGGTNSEANDIGDDETVVGSSEIGGGATHAFVGKFEGGITDLNALLLENPLGLVLVRASAVNRNGQIVAEGTIGADTATHAILLTPADRRSIHERCRH